MEAIEQAIASTRRLHREEHKGTTDRLGAYQQFERLPR
jgi:hypothetical protein